MLSKTMLFVKMVLVGFLAIVILVSLLLVDNLIGGRQQYRDEAVQSIGASYASSQRLLGPILVQPYRITTTEIATGENGVKRSATRIENNTYVALPQTLNLKGELKPSLRRHGLYSVPVYELDALVTGHFDFPAAPIKESGASTVEFGIPYLAFAVKDARGIAGQPVIQVNGANYRVEGAPLTTREKEIISEKPVWGSNLRVLLPPTGGKAGSYDVRLELALAGTQKLELVPVADINHFELKSSWSEPLFGGAELPRERTISSTGFNAVWDISSLASATQSQMLNNNDKMDTIDITLAQTVDAYTLSDRAVKYGILFVLLTFGGFFLFEIVKQMQIHPVQYLLVGFCLAVFFLLLVSFSEHMSFGVAYVVSSTACIGLLTYYLAFVLHSRLYGLSFGSILTALYSAIYGLLISEDNALLLGSLLLFGLIALVMISTRKVNWYERTEVLGRTGSMSGSE